MINEPIFLPNKKRRPLSEPALLITHRLLPYPSTSVSHASGAHRSSIARANRR